MTWNIRQGHILDVLQSLEAEVERLTVTEAMFSNEAMRWAEEMKVLEAERDHYKDEADRRFEALNKIATAPWYFRMSDAMRLAQSALDQQEGGGAK